MTLDVHSRALLENLAKQGVKPFHQMDVAQARGFMTSLRDAIGRGPNMHRVDDITRGEGEHTIRLRALVPASRSSGVIVYCHGGGWALMSIDDYDALGRQLAYETQCTVVLVDYRLAPEHP
jgi:acetyl esterase